MSKESTLTELKDMALIRLALENNQQAWSEIVRRYNSKVMSTVYRIHNNRTEAEDIVQEVFIELAKSLKNFKGEAALSTFIYRITVNTTYKHIKKNEKKNFATVAIDYFSNILSDTKEIAPSEILEKEDTKKVVHAALKKLSTDKRTALILFEIEELTLKEISEILKLPLQTVWSRVYNARKDLLKILKKTRGIK